MNIRELSIFELILGNSQKRMLKSFVNKKMILYQWTRKKENVLKRLCTSLNQTFHSIGMKNCHRLRMRMKSYCKWYILGLNLKTEELVIQIRQCKKRWRWRKHTWCQNCWNLKKYKRNWQSNWKKPRICHMMNSISWFRRKKSTQ